MCTPVVDPEVTNNAGKFAERRPIWWESLSRISSMRFTLGYIGFLMFVPFVVGIMKLVPEGNALTLPVTWFFGYLAGLCFLLGIILVHVFCPDILKPGRTLRNIEEEGRTIQYVVQELRETYLLLAKLDYPISRKDENGGIVCEYKSRANHFLRCVFGCTAYVENAVDLRKVETARENVETARENIELPTIKQAPYNREELWSLMCKELFQFKEDEGAMREVFWNVHFFAGHVRPGLRSACTFLFGLGAFFALLLLGRQTWEVFQACNIV